MLRKALNDRLAAKGYVLEWADIIRDLDDLEEIRVIQENKAFLLRSQVGSIRSKPIPGGRRCPPKVP